MSANREPSNQSFEVDREATVCLANRRFLFDNFFVRLSQQQLSRYRNLCLAKDARDSLRRGVPGTLRVVDP